ncbi:MAG: hypothetical protein ABEI52_11090 [Halobacteriaceae archaeon]
MHQDPDKLSGIVDAFGALEREELRNASRELAFKKGVDFNPDVHRECVERALDEYVLVELDGLLIAGPTAFPDLPDGGDDLPHILEVSYRDIDRESFYSTIEQRFRSDAANAIQTESIPKCRKLIDMSYDLSDWGIKTDTIRDRLVAELERLEDGRREN